MKLQFIALLCYDIFIAAMDLVHIFRKMEISADMFTLFVSALYGFGCISEIRKKKKSKDDCCVECV